MASGANSDDSADARSSFYYYFSMQWKLDFKQKPSDVGYNKNNFYF
jgi:hypothetical protein